MRGAAGGALFGIPLLYTMEVWWLGAHAPMSHAALVFGLSFVVVALLIHTAGFRRSRDMHWSDVVLDTGKAVALGVVSAALVLALLREIRVDIPLTEIVGKLAFEAAPFAIGVAVAGHVISKSTSEEGENVSSDSDRRGLGGTLADLGATMIGAIFVGFNIAPTDEISMIAVASTPFSLICLMIATLVITYGIVFEAGFGDQAARRAHEGVLQHPVTETTVAYLISLLTSAGMLLFFRNIQPGDPWPVIVQHTVILGLPAAIGGAAGRLAI